MRTKITLGILLLMLLPQAVFAAVKYTWGVSGACTGGDANGFGDKCPLSAPLTTTTAKAYAYSTTYGSGADTGQLENAYLGSYSGGLGVINRDGVTATSGCASSVDCAEGTPASQLVPEHAMDNNGRYDSILFSFTDKVSLTALQIGYPAEGTTTCNGVPCDSDITVLAYTGSDTPALANGVLANGTSFTKATMAGWVLVGNYADVVTATTNTADITSGSMASVPNGSKYWIVAAYDPLWSGGSCPTTGALSCGNDYVKVLSLSGNRVPEPNTILLLSIAAGATFWGNRRRPRKI